MNDSPKRNKRHSGLRAAILFATLLAIYWITSGSFVLALGTSLLVCTIMEVDETVMQVLAAAGISAMLRLAAIQATERPVRSQYRPHLTALRMFGMVSATDTQDSKPLQSSHDTTVL